MSDVEERLRALEMKMTAGGGDLPEWARNGLRAAYAMALEDAARIAYHTEPGFGVRTRITNTLRALAGEVKR